MTIIDVISLVIIFFCSVFAFFKGAFGELISLASLVLGYFLYRLIAPYVLSSIAIGFPFSIIFDLILLAISIFILSISLHKMTAKLRQDYTSASSDMLVGMVLGIIKGYVITVIIFSILFDIFVDKDVMTGKLSEREGVPSFLYRARSYSFLRDSYIAFHPVMKKVIAEMRRQKNTDLESLINAETSTTIDSNSQATQDTLLDLDRKNRERRYGGNSTPESESNPSMQLQFKLNDYTINLAPATSEKPKPGLWKSLFNNLKGNSTSSTRSNLRSPREAVQPQTITSNQQDTEQPEFIDSTTNLQDSLSPSEQSNIGSTIEVIESDSTNNNLNNNPNSQLETLIEDYTNTNPLPAPQTKTRTANSASQVRHTTSTQGGSTNQHKPKSNQSAKTKQQANAPAPVANNLDELIRRELSN